MNTTVQWISSQRLCQELGLSAEARACAADDCAADQFLDRLRRGRHYSEALRVLPHLLPKRRTIWWGALCVWQAHREQLNDASAAAIDAVFAWIRQPGEAQRRACEAAAKAAGIHSSPGCIAMAAFWSTGSMSLPGLPLVAPPRTLAAKAVAGAVLLAAAEHEPQRFHENYQQFLSIGEQVARGRLLWQVSEPVQPIAARSYRLDGSTAVPPPHWLTSSFVAAAGGDATNPKRPAEAIQ